MPTNISMPDATDLLTRVFLGAGCSQTSANSVASALVAAEAEGQMGHGFSRVADYVAQAKTGKARADAKITVTHRGPASIFVDAGLGFAYPALDRAFEALVPLAKAQGIAVAAIGNSHHCGALSVQVDRLAREGLIALMVANTPKAMAPWGAREAVFGTNPIAFASPRTDALPLVIDLSLSRVARGKVMAAKKAGTDIPEGWALDAKGQSTTDADAALAGTMVPIGAAKGTALALMVELLAAAFTDSAFSFEAGSFFSGDGAPPRVGQTIIAISPGSESSYAQRAEALLTMISELEGARLPGSRRLNAIAHAQTHGLDVPDHLLKSATELADGWD